MTTAGVRTRSERTYASVHQMAPAEHVSHVVDGAALVRGDIYLPRPTEPWRTGAGTPGWEASVAHVHDGRGPLSLLHTRSSKSCAFGDG